MARKPNTVANLGQRIYHERLKAKADAEYATRIDAQRVTLEFTQRSTRRLDTGKVPIEESPLFGGSKQTSLFEEGRQ